MSSCNVDLMSSWLVDLCKFNEFNRIKLHSVTNYRFKRLSQKSDSSAGGTVVDVAQSLVAVDGCADVLRKVSRCGQLVKQSIIIISLALSTDRCSSRDSQSSNQRSHTLMTAVNQAIDELCQMTSHDVISSSACSRRMLPIVPGTGLIPAVPGVYVSRCVPSGMCFTLKPTSSSSSSAAAASEMWLHHCLLTLYTLYTTVNCVFWETLIVSQSESFYRLLIYCIIHVVQN